METPKKIRFLGLEIPTEQIPDDILSIYKNLNRFQAIGISKRISTHGREADNDKDCYMEIMLMYKDNHDIKESSKTKIIIVLHNTPTIDNPSAYKLLEIENSLLENKNQFQHSFKDGYVLLFKINSDIEASVLDHMTKLILVCRESDSATASDDEISDIRKLLSLLFNRVEDEKTRAIMEIYGTALWENAIIGRF